MKTTITLFLLSLSFLSCQKKEKSLDETLEKAITWMWQQQSADGGWHSQTHAVLKDGIALTPYILFQLCQIEDEIFAKDEKSVDKAVDFIIKSMRSSMNKDSTAITNYPNYSAAYALRVLHKLNRDTSLQNMIVNYLLGQQFIENRGFTPDSLAYGGWGYGETDLKTGEHGHEDVSHTRRIVEALIEVGYIEVKVEAKAKAVAQGLWHSKKEKIIVFLKGVQRSKDDHRLYEGCISRSALPYDGGFVSSVVTLETNKSQPIFIKGAGYHYPSYATATCDGFLAMHALGMKDTPSYSDAANWLRKNQSISTIDGLSKNDPEQWTYIMHYYHLSVRSEAMSIIEPDGAWRDSISTILINEQLPDGDYINPIGGVNKEDDPLMGTIFCIQAWDPILRVKK